MGVGDSAARKGEAMIKNKKANQTRFFMRKCSCAQTVAIRGALSNGAGGGRQKSEFGRREGEQRFGLLRISLSPKGGIAKTPAASQLLPGLHPKYLKRTIK